VKITRGVDQRGFWSIILRNRKKGGII